MNLLTDKLPTEYKGYKINTDFRVGIQLLALLEKMDDADKEDMDTMDDIIDLLWGNGVPTTVSEDGLIVVDYNLIWETISWFKCGGNPEFKIRRAKRMPPKKASELAEDIPFDFEEDSGLILASFIQQYNIDLTKTNMHWFKFLALFEALQDTSFTRLQEVRTLDTTGMTGKQLNEANKAKYRARVTNVTKKREAELRKIFGDEWEEHI